MPTAVAANAYAVDSKWNDPDTGEAWLHFIVHALCYAAYAAMPEVLSCEGTLYRKMGFNTDTGRVAYKKLAKRDLAKPPCACGKPALDSYATCEECHDKSLDAAESYYDVQ